MIKENKLILFKKYEDLICYTNNLMLKYPKSERFHLTAQMSKIMYLCQEKIAFFTKETYKANKIKYLHELDVYLSMFKGYIRISHKNKYISHQNYATWAKYITEICNIVGGLISNAKDDKK